MTSGRPSQSNSCQLEDLKSLNLDGWLEGCNDEDNLHLVPVETVNIGAVRMDIYLQDFVNYSV